MRNPNPGLTGNNIGASDAAYRNKLYELRLVRLCDNVSIAIKNTDQVPVTYELAVKMSRPNSREITDAVREHGLSLKAWRIDVVPVKGFYPF